MGKKTDELNQVLEHIKPEELSQFLNDNWDAMFEEEREFTKFMRESIRKKGLKWKDVYNAAGISENYGQEVIGMRKHVKNRDLIIKLCLGGRLNLEETQHALVLYGMQPLYPRIPRDTVFIVAINRRIYDLCDIDDMLSEQGFEIISTEIK